MSNSETQVIKFANVNIPIPYESFDKSAERYVWYGTDNLYPNYLLKLYNESPIHASIINSKANYIIGEGLQITGGKAVDVKVNPADKADEFLNKIIKDYLIFNYFAVEVVYNVFNQPIEYYHVPAHHVRMNRDKTKFWVSRDWCLHIKPIVYDRFRQKSKDSTSKIFFFDGYNPSETNVYATPDYSGSIRSIQNDIEIREFNLNNIKNHFSPSTIITFFRGSNVPEEIKRQIVQDLRESYTGASGKKMIVDFQDPNNPSADVKNISPNDWDKAYQEVAKKVSDDIFIGHGVTSPMLFGVKTEGQIGGATELETAYEIFKNTVVNNKRNELQEALNTLFAEFEQINGEVEFIDKPLFSARISEDLKEKIYTVNELREEAGLPPLPNGDRLLSEVPKVTDSIKDPTSPAATAIVQQSKQFNAIVINLTDEDFEKVKNMGVGFEDFDFISEGEFVTSKEHFSQLEAKFELQDEVAEYLLKNDVSGMSINEIKAALRKDLGLNVSNSDLQNILQSLKDSGVIQVDIQDGKAKVSKPNAPSRKIETMYQYQVRPGYGEPVEQNTRPFCKKLIENNKLYTREEIQTMASIFGYDIFSYGGGYYHNPSTGETTSHCRHQFRQRTVTKRKK